MRRSLGVIVALCLGSVLTATLGVLPAKASQCGLYCVGPHRDPAGFQGEAVVWPAGRGRDLAARYQGEASSCPDCRWHLAPSCEGNRPGGSDDRCRGSVQTCEPGSNRFDVWLWMPGAPWRQLTTMCLGAGEMPVSRAALEAAIRDSFLELVPVLRPSCQPSGAAVVQLPTYFQSNQPASLSRPGLRLLGFTVDLAATPTWTWRPAPGAKITTSDPGGRWPDGTVSHVYRSPGTASVSVTASWSGTYRLDGAPAVAVPGGPVTQSASLSFPIREARAELVAGN